MKFKIGQVVAIKSSKNKDYRFVSGIGHYRSSTVYFLNGDTAIQELESDTLARTGPYQNPFWFDFMLRKLTAREAGR